MATRAALVADEVLLTVGGTAVTVVEEEELFATAVVLRVFVEDGPLSEAASAGSEGTERVAEAIPSRAERGEVNRLGHETLIVGNADEGVGLGEFAVI